MMTYTLHSKRTELERGEIEEISDSVYAIAEHLVGRISTKFH